MGQSKQTVRAEARQAKRTPPQRGSVPRLMWVGLAAIVAMSAYSAWDSRRLGCELKAIQGQARIEEEDRRRMETALARAEREKRIVEDPASVQIPMPAAQKAAPGLRAYWHARLGIVAAGRNIPASPGDRALQLWLIPKTPGSKPLSAGLFAQRLDGNFVALVPDPPLAIAETKALTITEEPAGGSPQPTGAPRWAGRVP